MHTPGQSIKLRSWAIVFSACLLAVPGVSVPQNSQPADACEQVSSPGSESSRFQLNVDGSATDRTTGLTWTRCPVGLHWREESCVSVSPANWFSWVEAESETIGKLRHPALQGEGWRLPSLREMETLLRRSCGTPYINIEVFPDPGSRIFWTKDSDAENGDFAWTVDFANNRISTRVKESNPLRVLLVRGAPLPDPDPEEILIWNDGIHDTRNDTLLSLQAPQEALSLLPSHRQGGIDWVRALEEGRISPRVNIEGSDESMELLDQEIIFMDTGVMPWVRFPHRPHSEWLACGNCHDDPFPAGKTRIAIDMQDIWTGKYCGICHGNVAFSAYQCARCHSIPHEGSLQLE